MMNQDIIVEIETINKRVNELAKDIMSKEKSRERRIYQENDWDFGQDKNPHSSFKIPFHSSFHIPQDHLLLDEDFENYERSQRSTLREVWSWLKLVILVLIWVLLLVLLYLAPYLIELIFTYLWNLWGPPSTQHPALPTQNFSHLTEFQFPPIFE